MAQQALDTFIAEIDGTPVRVEKGRVFADNDPVVKIDQGRGLLFRQLEYDEPPKRPRGRPRKTAVVSDSSDGNEDEG